MSKPKILVVCDYYLPGYKSGGGMRTIVNMVDRLRDRFDFWIITRDHDGKLDKEQYRDVEIDAWNDVRGARVFYLSKPNIGLRKLRSLVLEVEPDAIYANSFFSTLAIFALKLRKLKLITKVPIVIAPCGELTDGALKIKSGKKRAFLKISGLSGLYNDVIWKASSELEKEEILRVKGKGGRIFIAPDLPPKILLEDFCPEKKPEKISGEARFVFLSRFMPKKNFKWLLENFPETGARLTIDIYGPLEDRNYWEECQRIIEKFPPNISIKARDSIPYEQVCEKLLEYHFFILPTLSENFGHVFLEALAAGCPLVISDRTPWLGLEKKGIGWDLSLEEPEKWAEVIKKCLEMNAGDYVRLSGKARSFALVWLADEKVERDTVEVLNYSLSKRSAF
ncbi:MAG: glycosyltransferase family 4 protein [Pyrinomonadaceae bacterium]